MDGREDLRAAGKVARAIWHGQRATGPPAIWIAGEGRELACMVRAKRAISAKECRPGRAVLRNAQAN